MAKRALLTGVGGFVGHHVLEFFLRNTDWEIICVDSFRHKGTCRRVDEILSDGFSESDKERVKVYVHDLSVPIDPQLENLILERRVDDRGNLVSKPLHYVFNLASESAVERSTTDPVACLRNNYELSINMLEFARRLDKDHRLEQFVHISTDEVYGEAGPTGSHVEWDRILPSNPYAASKAAQEAMCIAYWRTYNLPISIVNIMNMIGERQDPEKFLPKIIQKVAVGEEMPIYCDKSGGDIHIGSRVYLHAQNMASALVFIAGLRCKRYKDFELTYEAVPDRYNVCGDQELNNLELAQLVAKTMGKDLKYKLVESDSARPGYDRRYSLDGSKLLALGWKPAMTFEESIKRIIDWSLENSHWVV